MLFLEEWARLLLVLHAVLGAATVAVSTHLFLWSRKWTLAGQRARGVRIFAVVGLALYVIQFALGNLAYPTYRVRVRAEFLEMPSAVAADAEVRRHASDELRRRAGAAPAPATATATATERAVGQTSWIARLFDIKEHWAALGLPLMAIAAWLILRWNPRTEPSPPTRWLLLAATGGAATAAWLAALVGLYVSGVRAIS